MVPGILMLIPVDHLKIMIYAPPGYAGIGACKLCVKELLHVPTIHPVTHSMIYLAFVPPFFTNSNNQDNKAGRTHSEK